MNDDHRTAARHRTRADAERDRLPAGRRRRGHRRTPTFPRWNASVLAYWAKDKTFQASVEQRPAGDNGANEYVFYDGPPFANGLPHYGHLLTGYVKDVVPRYQTMRGRRVERRFGWDTHGLPAEVEAERQLGHQAQVRDRRHGHRGVQRRLPGIGAALHPRVAGVRHPAGPLGRLRQRLQDPRPGLHGVRDVGLQDVVGQGLDLRGLPGALVLHALRDAAVGDRDQDGRHLPVPAGPGGDGVAPAAVRRPAAGRGQRAGLDHHAVDAAVQPGRRGQPRRRLRRRRVGRPVRRPVPAGRRPGRRVRSASWGRTRRCWRPSPARSWPAPATPRRSTSSSGGDGPCSRSSAHPGPDRRLRHHRGRHRGGAHRAGLR